MEKLESSIRICNEECPHYVVHTPSCFPDGDFNRIKKVEPNQQCLYQLPKQIKRDELTPRPRVVIGDDCCGEYFE